MSMSTEESIQGLRRRPQGFEIDISVALDEARMDSNREKMIHATVRDEIRDVRSSVMLLLSLVVKHRAAI